MTAPAIDDRVSAGLAALERHAWKESYDLLKAADADHLLGGPELARLATVEWWLGRLDDSVDTLERAYEAHAAAGDREAAAHIALELVRSYAWKSARSQAAGWLSRAVHLVEDIGGETPVLAELLVTQAQIAEAMQDLEGAERLAQQAMDTADRFGRRDEAALAMHQLGQLISRRGDLRRGFELIDEATAMAVSGDLSPQATGYVYCQTISICHDLADFERAGEWTEAATRWCERRSINGFPGVCRVHRAELLRLRGAWERADSEAAAACAELPGYNPAQAGAAFRELGEIRLRRGNLDGAEEAFRRAHELGAGPGPGIALLNLARGDAPGALASIRRSVDSVRDRIFRARLLPALVEIAIAAGDLDVAAAGVEELIGLTADFDRPLFAAEAATAAGRLALARGDSAEAARQLSSAVNDWNAVDAPYEAAQARLLLGQAQAGEGDLSGARLELETARSVFERLGAPLAAAAATRLLETAPGQGPAARAGYRAYLFTDIVQSTNLVELIGDDSWSELIGWHDRAMRELFARHDAVDVEGRGDGFFATFDTAGAAVECAIAIQRALAEHRRQYGFAPKVRIGLHAAVAHRSEEGYMGVGVHVAARVAALAEGDEILVSTSSLEPGSVLKLSQVRQVSLKGIGEPIEVAAIAWR